MAAGPLAGPASSRSTLVSLFSDRRLAITQPALPPPTMM